MGSKCCSPGAVTSSRSAQEQEGGAPDRVPGHGMWAAQELKPVTSPPTETWVEHGTM